MSHVDEGALHAYLDGALEEYPTGEARRIRAHLERCERCAEALAEARLTRDRAESVLAAPELNVTPPPLEELKRIARSGAGEKRASRSWGRRQRIGWAASVAVALGIGWIVRGGMPMQNVGPDRTASSAEAAPAADLAYQGGEGTVGVVAEAPAARPESRPETVSGASGAEGSSNVATSEAERTVPVEEPTVMAQSRPAAPAPYEAEVPAADVPETLMDVDATSVSTGETARMADELDVPVDVAATTFDSAVAADAPAESMAVAPTTVAVAPVAFELVEDTARLAEERGRERAEERAAAPRSEAGRLSLASRSAGAGSALARGVDVEAGSDDRQSGDPSEPGSLVVPGLEVLSIVWREEGVVPAGVRVIQRLDEDRELELIHLPAGFDPSSVPPAEAGVNELVVPRDQGWLILRAALEEPELRELLERMDTPDPDV